MVQILKEIINYVNSVKGHSKPSFNSESTVNLYDRFVQEWGEHFWKFIEKFQDKPWGWGLTWKPDGLSHNHNITMEIIEKYPDKPWDWKYISKNPNITMEFIEKYPDKNWDWFWLSDNPNITMEFIEKYPDKPWHWEGISCHNPNITMEFIEKYPDKD